MTVSSPPRHFIGEQEYLDGELHGELRHEYIDGQVYAMTGASDRHGLILNALAYSMTPAARRKGCQLFTSDMKLRLEIGGKTCFYYPDLLLSCDPQDREPYFRRSPCLIVEVLSESTARIDRREKLLAYQSLPACRRICWWSRRRGAWSCTAAPPTGAWSTTTRARSGWTAWSWRCHWPRCMRMCDVFGVSTSQLTGL